MSLTSSTPDVVYEYAEGDTLPKPKLIIKSLVSTGFTFSMRILREDGTSLTKAGTITDDGSVADADGNFQTEVEFTLLSTDMTLGTHTAQMNYTDTGGDVATVVKDIEIRVVTAL